MKSFLLFQLYGSLSAWGDIAVGGERPTATHPGRSAILGMLAAAAGIRRDEEAKHLALEQGYGMAVRMESAGTFLKDYHTTQVPPQVAMKKHPGVTRRDELMALSSYQKTNPKTSGTILSNRAYRCDGLYQIALWEREQENTPFGLYHLIDCLNHPRFVLYLGRKSCPLALPLQPHIVESATVVDAYEQAKFISLRSFLKEIGVKKADFIKGQAVSLFWDGEEDSGIPARETFIRRDAILSRNRWQFEERREHHAVCQQQEDENVFQ